MPNNDYIMNRNMKSTDTRKEYVIPAFRVVLMAVEGQFLASQLDDYDDNPIFSDPSPWGEEF